MVDNPGKSVTQMDIVGLFWSSSTTLATVEQAEHGVLSKRIHPFNQDIFYNEDFALPW